ncbi:MAG: hypothetical protein ACYSWQ_02455 [Planctomycetota bacterium]
MIAIANWKKRYYRITLHVNYSARACADVVHGGAAKRSYAYIAQGCLNLFIWGKSPQRASRAEILDTIFFNRIDYIKNQFCSFQLVRCATHKEEVCLWYDRHISKVFKAQRIQKGSALLGVQITQNMPLRVAGFRDDHALSRWDCRASCKERSYHAHAQKKKSRPLTPGVPVFLVGITSLHSQQLK